MLVTPEQAREWIRRSHQRQIDLLKARRVLDAVEAENWQDDGSYPMKVRKNILLDGHHRALAVLMHGQPIDMAVEFT